MQLLISFICFGLIATTIAQTSTQGRITCYEGVSFSGAGIKENFPSLALSQQKCRRGFACVDVRAHVLTVAVPFEIRGSGSVGFCYPPNHCRHLTCVDINSHLPSELNANIEECTIRCCHGNLCNSPLDPNSTNAPVLVVPSVSPKSRLTCQIGVKVVVGEFEEDFQYFEVCDEGFVCANVNVDVVISQTNGGGNIKGKSFVGLCQNRSHCEDDNRKDQLCNTIVDFLPTVYTSVTEECVVKCCQQDLCNDPFQESEPVQDIPLPAINDGNPDGDVVCDLLDVAFIVDASSSIGRRHFNKLRSFLKRLVGKLPVGVDKTRVAAIRFSDYIFPLWHFVHSLGSYELNEIIDIMEYTGGRKRVANLFYRVSVETFSRFRGNRPNVPDVVVIFTDGQSRERPALKVRWLKRMDIRVITVAVGNRINKNQLRGIASQPKVNNVFSLKNINGLMEALRNTSKCFSGTRCYFGPNLSGAIKNSFQTVKRCDRNFACLNVRAALQPPFPFPGSISFGNCVPQSVCATSNCSRGLAFIPSIYSDTIRNCTKTCCHEDLCNVPR